MVFFLYVSVLYTDETKFTHEGATWTIGTMRTPTQKNINSVSICRQGPMAGH